MSDAFSFDWRLLCAWVVVAIAALSVIGVILKIVSRVVSASLRAAIIIGSLLVIAVALCVLSTLLQNLNLP